MLWKRAEVRASRVAGCHLPCYYLLDGFGAAVDGVLELVAADDGNSSLLPSHQKAGKHSSCSRRNAG